jgi:hypothetical protein
VRRTSALFLICAVAAAAPKGELLREEEFNYRVVGELPRGWKQAPGPATFRFSLDGIVHAHVHLVRQRIGADLDPAAQVKKRVPYYLFPNAPDDSTRKIGTARWAGYDAVLFEHEVRVRGVLCRRRVLATFRKSVWYELIQTVYGEKTIEDERCSEGLATFREGFRLLAEPLRKGTELETAEATLESRELGYRLTKPQGYHQTEVDTAVDPGCRVAFERSWPPDNRHVRVRLFEYGVRGGIDPKLWLGNFYRSFAFRHRESRREPVKDATVAGAREVHAERFVGLRDSATVTTLVLIARAKSGRVFALRIRSQGDAPVPDQLLRLD